MDMHVEMCFLNFFYFFIFWERFSGIVPMPVDFEAMEMVETVVHRVRKLRKSHSYTPRAWRWSRVKKAENKSLANVIDKEEEFAFSPYI